MQRLDRSLTAGFLVIYNTASAGPLLSQGPATVISPRFSQSKVLPQGVAWACAILIAHYIILAMPPFTLT